MRRQKNEAEKTRKRSCLSGRAGPSDAELITVKGKRLMEEADVIVYDRLVGSSILHMEIMKRNI